MDLVEALAYLDRHVNLEATAGRVEGLSLERMRRLVNVMGDPQSAYPVVHITGTNGKGSVARMITSVLAEAGLTIGTYTSPHLERLNERISRNGDPVEDRDLAELITAVAAVEPLAEVMPSYFEIVTAAAFRWFADVAVDVAVIEVGLLGRWDATNVADGTVAVVTNVGHDHTDFQGDWRRAIAEEKAGIVKPGATLILGATDPEVAPIFRDAATANVFERDRDFACTSNQVAVGGRLLELRTALATYEQVFLPLHGAHQGDNAALALTAAEAFFDRALDTAVVTTAMAKVSVPGRFEVAGRNPLVVLDGAHNHEGAAAARQTLDDDFSVAGRRILVVGMLGPRPVPDVMAAFGADRTELVVACTPDSPRAIPAQRVAAAAAALGAATEVVPDVAAAVDRALEVADEEDAVLVSGSLYVVGAARSHLLR